MENLCRPIMNKKIELIILKLPTKKIPGPAGLTDEVSLPSIQKRMNTNSL